MNPRARLALVLAVLAGVAGIVLISTGTEDGPRPPRAFPSGTATPQLPTCLKEPPPKRPTPSWFPRSMPLPPGSYVHEVPDEPAPGINVAQLYLPVSLDDFVTFVLSRWERAGWKPGIGEREPGEAEDTFVGPDDLYGQFRAQSIYCDQGATNLYIAIAKNEPAPQPS